MKHTLAAFEEYKCKVFRVWDYMPTFFHIDDWCDLMERLDGYGLLTEEIKLEILPYLLADRCE